MSRRAAGNNVPRSGRAKSGWNLNLIVACVAASKEWRVGQHRARHSVFLCVPRIFERAQESVPADCCVFGGPEFQGPTRTRSRTRISRTLASSTIRRCSASSSNYLPIIRNCSSSSKTMQLSKSGSETPSSRPPTQHRHHQVQEPAPSKLGRGLYRQQFPA